MVVSAGCPTGRLHGRLAGERDVQGPALFLEQIGGRAGRLRGARVRAVRYESQKLMVLSKVKDLYTMAKTSERLLSLYEAGIIPRRGWRSSPPRQTTRWGRSTF